MPYLIQRNRQVAGLPAPPDSGPAISAAGRRVAIIGAGDTSADCLGNVLREGAEAVYEIGHGPEPPRDTARLPSWPDRPFLLREYPVHHEGGERVWQWEPAAFSGDGRVTRLSGHRVEYRDSDSPAAQGGRKPRIATEGEPAHLDVDLVLIAVGFTGVEREKPLLQHPDLLISDRDTIDVSNFATSIPGVYAAGDCVRGADLIVTAISQGRECARTVDGYLAGWTDLPSRDAVRMSHLPA